MYVWVDIETTGLDPFTDQLLEVALMATSDDLDELDSVVYVLRPNEPIDSSKVDPYVMEMHTKSGLWGDIRSFGIPREIAQAKLMGFLASLGQDVGTQPMCGSSVQFDRGFLEVWMPDVARWFHYRNIDVSTIKEVGKRHNPIASAGLPKPKKLHRGIDDLYDTVDEFKFYLANLFVAPTTNNSAPVI